MPDAPDVIPDSEVERVLLVAAHPDDIDFGASATVARLTDAGAQVSYCICTDGDAGGFDPAVPRSEIPSIRRREQTAAAAVVGVTDISWLGYGDGRLEATQDLRRDISRVIRRVRPRRVIVPSPEYYWERLPASHPDHLAAGRAAVSAVYPDARNPFAHVELLQVEGLEAWAAEEMWLMAHHSPDHAVDISATIDRKIAALRAHESQTAHMADLDTWIRDWAVGSAARFELAPGSLAELFKVVRIG